MVFGGSLTLVFSEETWEAVRGPKGLSSELGFPRGGIRVPRYLVLYRANPSVWPTDAKKALAVWEGTIAGGDHLLKTGALKEVGWFTPQEGYAIFESDSKEKVLGMVQPFFPYYDQDIREIVSWENAKEALLGSARRAASR